MLDLLRDPDIYMNRTIIFVYEAYLDSISKLAFLSQVHSRTENLGFFCFAPALWCPLVLVLIASSYCLLSRATLMGLIIVLWYMNTYIVGKMIPSLWLIVPFVLF